jgi:1-aminocyclopropane-1-carboxylate deaminase
MLNFQQVQNIKLTSQVSIKPEFKIHETVSGNKFRKLKYNLKAIQKNGSLGVLTFGGAFSNHIAATAAAGQLLNVSTVGIIRGEELATKIETNPTLAYAKSCGMQLEFVSRSVYKQKTDSAYIEYLQNKYPKYYIIPEGGTNALAVQGCEEILTQSDEVYNVICCPVGTGGTISGLINSSLLTQKIIGFPALKGAFLSEDICKFATQSNWELCNDYHFGGYAKVDTGLIRFINNFKKEFEIQLDPVYTGKMMFGIFDLIQKGVFSASTKILAIHTGGLQGIEGMNRQLKQKRMGLIV